MLKADIWPAVARGAVSWTRRRGRALYIESHCCFFQLCSDSWSVRKCRNATLSSAALYYNKVMRCIYKKYCGWWFRIEIELEKSCGNYWGGAAVFFGLCGVVRRCSKWPMLIIDITHIRHPASTLAVGPAPCHYSPMVWTLRYILLHCLLVLILLLTGFLTGKRYLSTA